MLISVQYCKQAPVVLLTVEQGVTSSLESARIMSLSSGAAKVPLTSQDLKNLMRPS